MSIANRGIPTKTSPSGVTFAFIETLSGYLLKVRTKNQWRGISGMFPAVPDDVSFVSKDKVKVSFSNWASQEAEVAPPPAPKKSKKRYGRGDNRRRNWKASYYANRRGQ